MASSSIPVVLLPTPAQLAHALAGAAPSYLSRAPLHWVLALPVVVAYLAMMLFLQPAKIVYQDLRKMR
jgi:hypothetical protein